MQPVLQRLHDNGIGSILDYAAEVRGLAHLFVCIIVVTRLGIYTSHWAGNNVCISVAWFGATLYKQHYILIGCFCSSPRSMMTLFTNDLCLSRLSVSRRTITTLTAVQLAVFASITHDLYYEVLTVACRTTWHQRTAQPPAARPTTRSWPARMRMRPSARVRRTWAPSCVRLRPPARRPGRALPPSKCDHAVHPCLICQVLQVLDFYISTAHAGV